MALIEEIKNLQMGGASEEEIRRVLKQRGFSERDVSSSIDQLKIRDAVMPSEQSGDENNLPASAPSEMYHTPEISSPVTEEYAEMTPSMMSQDEEQPQAPIPEQEIPQSYPPQYQEYSQYQPYQSAISIDTISDVAEQISSEKFSVLKDSIEKMKEAKNSLSSKVESVSSRLERIEKILDKLQLSLLQKMGEYVNDVSYLKKELVETQKSFKASKKKHTHSS